MGNKTYGIDGKEYDSAWEASQANKRWMREIEQKEAIEEQNEILKKQIDEQRRLTQEQMENDRKIEIARQEHDKEMRLLSLCDEIGISKKIIDGFINHVADADDDDSVHDDLNIYRELDDITRKLYKLYGELVDQSNSKQYNDIITTKYDEISSYIIYAIISMVVGIGLLIILLIKGYTTAAFISFGVSFIITSIILCVYQNLKKNCEEENQNLMENKIINFDKTLNDSGEIFIYVLNFEYNNLDFIKDEEQQNPVLVEYRKQRDKLRNQERAIRVEELNSRIDDFYNFRLKHYNSKIEKFLDDFNFKEKVKDLTGLNINYKIVTKSMATGNGDIDDYVEYFTNVSK